MGRRPALALLDILRGEDVDRVFGNPGTTGLPLPFLADGRNLPRTPSAPRSPAGGSAYL